MNISLPESLKAFVDDQVNQRGYGTFAGGSGFGTGRASRCDVFRRIARSRSATCKKVKTKPVIPRGLANQDAEGALDHDLGEGAEQVAFGFIDSLELAYARISRHPATGSPRYAHELNLPGLRFWPLALGPLPVPRFPC